MSFLLNLHNFWIFFGYLGFPITDTEDSLDKKGEEVAIFSPIYDF